MISYSITGRRRDASQFKKVVAIKNQGRMTGCEEGLEKKWEEGQEERGTHGHVAAVIASDYMQIARGRTVSGR